MNAIAMEFVRDCSQSYLAAGGHSDKSTNRTSNSSIHAQRKSTASDQSSGEASHSELCISSFHALTFMTPIKLTPHVSEGK